MGQIDRKAVVEELLGRSSTPTLESLFGLVRDWGLRVNNLFHRMDGQWQANLRSRDAMDFFEFGWGPTAPAAMLSALQRVAKGDVVARPPSDADREATTPGSTKLAEAPAPAPPAASSEDIFG